MGKLSIADAARNVMDLNKSSTEQRETLYEQYKKTPDFALKNARCSKKELFTKNNSLTARVKRFFKEKGYYVGNDWLEKIAMALQLAVIVLVLYVSLKLFLTDHDVQIISRASHQTEASKEKTKKLNAEIKRIDIARLSISCATIFVVGWKLFKRTTARCKRMTIVGQQPQQQLQIKSSIAPSRYTTTRLGSVITDFEQSDA